METVLFRGRGMTLDGVVEYAKNYLKAAPRGNNSILSTEVDRIVRSVEEMEIGRKEKAEIIDKITNYALSPDCFRKPHYLLGASLYNVLLSLKNEGKGFFNANRLADLKTLKRHGLVYTKTERVEIDTPFGKVTKTFNIVRLSSYALENMQEFERLSKNYAEKQIAKLRKLEMI